MSDDEHQIPGVTLYFKTSSIGKPGGPGEAFRVHVELDAVVNNEAVWETVAQRFKTGLRIYTQADFQEDVMAVMQKKAKEHVARIAELEKELAKYKAPLESFGAALRGKAT